MSGLETAIRNALERSDRSSAEVRARIYQSARQALENGLQKQQIEDPEVISVQRHRLEAVIRAIEMEERAALKERAQTPVVNLDEVTARGHAVERGPEAPTRRPELETKPEERSPAQTDGGLGALRPERDGPLAATRAEGSDGRSEATGSTVPPAPDPGPADRRPRKHRRRRSRFFSYAMIVATLAAAAGVAVWWIQTNDLLRSPTDTGVANPPATVDAEDFDGAAGLQTLGAQEGFSGNWVEVFAPGEAAAVKPGPRASAEPFDGDAGERLRLISQAASKDGDVEIEIPADVLAQLSGKSSTFALTVQAAPGKATEFSVECDLGALGGCGRHRFTVHDERIDMLFKINFDRGAAPSGPGKLVINSDVGGGGNSLDLFAIRVQPGG
ncbi:biotin transporter BioY [Sinorhizobium medicae]|uniref:biotin transporter BioY n=1 Tax=Sinorhizobium medicae TaxID=110321 RepID=UPI000FDCC879|nr:biotin transporter BioY [Sinorhizobium medicae]RVJ28714.1 biotin transporter BioY [Sinorhizobium medicae]